MKPVRCTDAMIRRYSGRGFWSFQTLVAVWERNAGASPTAEAIVDQRRRLTWGEAAGEIEALARNLIELGIARDEVVVGQLPNIIESVTLRLAMEKAGIIYLPGAMAWREKEIEHIVRTLKAAGVVGPGKYDGFDYGEMYRMVAREVPHLRHCIRWSEGEFPGALRFDNLRQTERWGRPFPVDRTFEAVETSSVSATTGSTGMPKLVESATAPTLLFGRVVAERLEITDKDIVASIGPVHWGPGIGAVYSGAPQRGGKIVLLEKFDSESALDLIERERVTVAVGSTAQLVAIVRSPAFDRSRLASLRAFYWAGAPLSHAIAREVEDKTDCVLVGAYGAMDAGYFACSSVRDSSTVRHLTVGKPLEGNEALIADDRGRRLRAGEIGEVWFRGACCFPGFFRDETATLQAWGKRGLAGWYKTGDVGQMDPEGNIRVLGRIKDVLYSEGKPVYPAEIENALLSHPQVLSAAVVGVPREQGITPVAYVIPRGSASLSYGEMVVYLRSQGLAEHKIPVRLEIRSCFPMSGDGLKISKKDLEAEARNLLGA